jgi:hypothetical protein
MWKASSSRWAPRLSDTPGEIVLPLAVPPEKQTVPQKSAGRFALFGRGDLA